MFQKILVPLDGSSLAEEVLPYAAGLAEVCGSTVVLLQVISVVRPGLAMAELSGPTGGAELVEEDLQMEEEKARTYLEWTAEPLRGRGLEVETATVRGVPATAIVQFARENGVDLIAISTHGRSGLGRLVFGSVADQVLRESGLPVLLIKPTGSR